MKFEFDTTQLKHQIEQNPLVAAGIGVAVIKGMTALMKANTQRKYAKVWRREVVRREKKK